MFRRSLLLTSFIVVFAGTASAATVKFHADLTPASEVPPTNSTGTGEANMTLDTSTHELTYDVTFSGFSSNVTAAHIHGPAPAGKNAGVVVPLGNNPKSPIHGSAKLTAEQQQLLEQRIERIGWAVHERRGPAGRARRGVVDQGLPTDRP